MHGQQKLTKEGLSVTNGNATTGASAGRSEEWRDGAKMLREEQDELLESDGFLPVGTVDLWAKGGVYYGRDAALQNIRRE
jgi:hypothetical protein